MGKNLVIVESPAKAKTINKILGKDFVVKASMGHVRDLPPKQLGVDIEAGFKPRYTNIKGKEKVLKELKAEAKTADGVYLAPDPDREGEAIAWHLKTALEKEVGDDQFFRVTYNEITAPAIREAFDHPSRIDQKKVDSQQARRVLDRIVGYQVSPLLWRTIRGASSAGRVQSVALRLVCEREMEIQNFVPEEFWVFGAQVRKLVDPRDPFTIRLARIDDEKAEIKNGEEAERILADLDQRKLVVTAIKKRELTRRAQPPYITSTLQQAGSRFFSFTPSRTMRIAQDLYEGKDFGEGPVGLITYMRTDSPSVSKTAQDQARGFINEHFGEAFLPKKPNVFKSRGSAQEAHEAIRPTDVHRTPDSLKSVLDPNELKLYRIIWERFVASQMAPARIAQRTVEITAAPTGDQKATYLFRATASEVTFPGYMKVTGEGKKKKEKKDGEADVDEEVEALPPLEEGEEVECLDWLKEQKFTQPPGRFTEASLVRTLEENGVGRPSTYAQILYTLQDRSYVEKEKRSLRPTSLGMKVNEYLVSHLPDLFDVGFTADLEERLDHIEDGSLEWTGMLADFYKNFAGWVEKAKGPEADLDHVRELLDLTSGVTEWSPPTKRGKRTYSDEKYVTSLRKQLDEGEKPISDRQLKALKKLLCRYHEQVPEIKTRAGELGLEEALAEATRPKEPPREATQRKLDLLQNVTFDEPRKVGKRTYDDQAFSQSLREQVEGGKRLTENQIRYLDKLVLKYADQVEGFDDMVEELGIDQETASNGVQAQAVLDLFKTVSEWKPPVQRGKRTWDDKQFFDSLSSQFQRKKDLSEKQLASLKKMAKRYAAQIPSYQERMEELGLPPLKKKAD